MSEKEKEAENRVWTVPNVLTMFRIVLIPIFVVLYLKGQYIPSLVVIGLSALSDMLDGFIARKFNMVSSLGKALDPIADKLSQLALMLCLLQRFWPQMLIPIVIIVIKELTTGIVALVTVHKTKLVKGAVWHGKVTTVLLYAMMMLHVIWFDIPNTVSWITVLVASAMMLLSFVLYNLRYIQVLKAYKEGAEPEETLKEDLEKAADFNQETEQQEEQEETELPDTAVTE